MREYLKWQERHDDEFHKIDLIMIGRTDGKSVYLYLGCVMRHAYIGYLDEEPQPINSDVATNTWEIYSPFQLFPRNTLKPNLSLEQAKAQLLAMAERTIEFVSMTHNMDDMK